MNKSEVTEALLGVDYSSMLYTMHTLPEARDGGISGDVGDSTVNPKNMNVLINFALSGWSLAKTTMTCSHLRSSSAASSNATKLSREPSARTRGGRATYKVRPCRTVSHGWRPVRKVSRKGGEPLVSPGASGPPQRPGAERHVVAIGLWSATGGTFTTQQHIRITTTHYSRHCFFTITYVCVRTCTAINSLGGTNKHN